MEGLKIYYRPDTQEWCAETVPTRKIMRNLEGSIFDMWSAASSMLQQNNSGPRFNFKDFEYESPELWAWWHTTENSYLLCCPHGPMFKTEQYTVAALTTKECCVSAMRLSIEPSEKEALIENWGLSSFELAENFVLQVNRLKLAFQGVDLAQTRKNYWLRDPNF